MALCEEHAKSMKTFLGEPKSAYNSRTRSGLTCLSWAPEIIKAGIWVLETTAVVHPQVVVCGARRTPVPQVAPTRSEASISDQTESRVPASYWAGQPTCLSQLAMNSSRDWVLNAAPLAGTCAGA